MEAIEKLIKTIPYGDIPPPFNNQFNKVNTEFIKQVHSIPVKEGFENRIMSKLDYTDSILDFYNFNDEVRVCKGFTIQTISNYPILEKDGVKHRDGDPVADAYGFYRCRNFFIYSVNDGCGWGVEPSYAARVASATFVLFMKNELEKNVLRTTEEIQELCRTGLALAHQTIIQLEVPEGKIGGTCTTCCGVIVPIIDNEELKKKGINSTQFEDIHQEGSKVQQEVKEYFKSITLKSKVLEKYQLIGLSVGDCKTFFIKNEQNVWTTEDLTYGSRLHAIGSNDPGGRIGIQGTNKRMDIRNAMVYHKILKWNDIIMVCSDGIHDNLEPQTRGFSPNEIQPELGDIKWFKLKKEQIEEINRNYSLKFISEVASHAVSVHQFHKMMMDAIIGVIVDRKKYMEDHPNNAVPNVFSGKLDHATLLLARPTF
ncbi:hypothetical protein ENUP19_0003G0035 [Entamoeba nuttalli]